MLDPARRSLPAHTTLRTHLGSLYAKTGCHRQTELVRLAAGA